MLSGQLTFGNHIEKMYNFLSVLLIISVCQNAEGNEMLKFFNESKWITTIADSIGHNAIKEPGNPKKLHAEIKLYA